MKYPCVRPGIAVYKIGKKQVRFDIQSRQEQMTFEVDYITMSIISFLDGKNSFEQISSKVSSIYSNYNKHILTNTIELLSGEGLIYDADFKHKIQDKFNYFTGQFDFLDSILDSTDSKFNSLSIQSKLSNTTVSVVGAGGLGTGIISLLTRCGIGNIRVFEADKVESRNLSNQSLYTSNDIGKSKIRAIEEWRERTGLPTKIRGFKRFLVNKDEVLQGISGSDFVFNCADQPTVQECSTLISSCCMKLKIPHIVGGGYSGHRGALGTIIIPGRTYCWSCYINSPDEYEESGELIIPARNFGSFSPIISLVSAIQVSDFIRFFSGLNKLLLANRFGDFILDDLEIKWTDIHPQDSCEHCQRVLT